ncbi:hypothetical protein GF369_02960 [Candidatus Peregrinibacteria bacterium]|nr:hypothetical protein [Candidatus Peregrinibacteria bacterium]
MIIMLRYLGFLFIVSSFFQSIPITVGLLHNESVFLSIMSFSISLGIGLAFVIATQKSSKRLTDLTIKRGMILAALSFTVIPLIGSIAFLPSMGYNLLDAYFESVSGFTTTGLTIYESIDHLPAGVRMWRAATQWMGGIGIVLFFLFLMTRVNVKNQKITQDITKRNKSTMALYKANGFSEKFESSLKHTLSNVMIIYGGITLFGIIALYGAGMPIFDSIAMTFTSVSTGGFSVTDSFYSSGVQLGILCLLMILGAFSFVSHNQLMKGKVKQFVLAFEKNVFLVFMVIASALAYVFYPDIKVVIFQIVSSFTTTGYSLTSIALLPQLFILLIMIGMIVGGCTASTAGGIKVGRWYYVLRAVPWYAKKRSLPEHAVVPLKVHKQNVDMWKLVGISIYIIAYICILFVGTILFMVFGYDFLDASFQVTSALGTVGLSTMKLATIPPILKGVLIIAMLFGRLEIFPLFIALKGVLGIRKHTK